MNKYAEISVMEFKPGKSVETFNSDEDFRSGTYGRELAGKVRITWDDDGSVEWVESGILHKVDKTTYVVTRPLTSAQNIADINDLLKPVDSDIVPITDIVAKVSEEFKTAKPARKRTTPAKKDES